MEVKTSELIDQALDWAVGVANSTPGLHLTHKPGKVCVYGRLNMPSGEMIDWPVQPSTDWAQADPLLQVEMMEHGMSLASIDHEKGKFAAYYWSDDLCELEGIGPTPLIAAMRALVQRKLGDEIDIPKELT